MPPVETNLKLMDLRATREDLLASLDEQPNRTYQNKGMGHVQPTYHMFPDDDEVLRRLISNPKFFPITHYFDQDTGHEQPFFYALRDKPELLKLLIDRKEPDLKPIADVPLINHSYWDKETKQNQPFIYLFRNNPEVVHALINHEKFAPNQTYFDTETKACNQPIFYLFRNDPEILHALINHEGFSPNHDYWYEGERQQRPLFYLMRDQPEVLHELLNHKYFDPNHGYWDNETECMQPLYFLLKDRPDLIELLINHEDFDPGREYTVNEVASYMPKKLEPKKHYLSELLLDQPKLLATALCHPKTETEDYIKAKNGSVLASHIDVLLALAKIQPPIYPLSFSGKGDLLNFMKSLEEQEPPEKRPLAMMFFASQFDVDLTPAINNRSKQMIFSGVTSIPKEQRNGFFDACRAIRKLTPDESSVDGSKLSEIVATALGVTGQKRPGLWKLMKTPLQELPSSRRPPGLWKLMKTPLQELPSSRRPNDMSELCDAVFAKTTDALAAAAKSEDGLAIQLRPGSASPEKPITLATAHSGSSLAVASAMQYLPGDKNHKGSAVHYTIQQLVQSVSIAASEIAKEPRWQNRRVQALLKAAPYQMVIDVMQKRMADTALVKKYDTKDLAEAGITTDDEPLQPAVLRWRLQDGENFKKDTRPQTFPRHRARGFIRSAAT